MNQEKIGRFIALLRKEKDMTQMALASLLGVSDKSVSKWERGINLPDPSLYIDLCKILGISLNELFTGERIDNKDFKEKADKNLMTALENSTFNLKDRIKFYKNKWLKDNLSKIIVYIISWLILAISLKMQHVDFYLIGSISGLLLVLFYLVLYNQMMKYIEDNAYGKK